MSTPPGQKSELSTEEKRAMLAQLLERRAARPRSFPLSFAQQRLWFLVQLQPGSAAYTIPTAVWIEGALDVGALARGLGEVVRRHATLRTTFALEDGQPVQVVAPASLKLASGRATPVLPFIDLGGLPPAEREAAALELARRAARCSFDLARGPLLRAALLRVDSEQHVLVLAMHHIISDGWSMKVLIGELSTLYRAFAAGQPSPLPAPAIQYADYAVWQRRRLQGDLLESQLAYWRGQLAGAPAVLALPTDHPRRPAAVAPGAHQTLLLPWSLANELVAIGQRASATLFMTLLATFQALLARYTGQDDIVVGTPIANRQRAEVERLIGFFVNTLVLRADLAGDPSFLELLNRVREAALGAYAHQELPFERLVEELRPARDLGRTPLFQVMFDLQNAPAPAAESLGVKLRSLPIAGAHAAFDLTLSAIEIGSGLSLTFEYDAGLFDATTIARMATRYRALLIDVARDPRRRLAELALLTERERHQLLVEWNDTWSGVRNQESGVRITYPVSNLLTSDSWLLTSDSWCLHELVEAQAVRMPDAVAVVFDAGVEDEGRRTTDERRTTNDEGSDSSGRPLGIVRHSSIVQLIYAELNARANQLAHHLHTLGVGPETPVAIRLDRSPELVIALLGVLKAGGACVPLDPAYPAERLDFMLRDSGARVLITTNDQRPTTNDQISHLVNLQADWPAIAQQPATPPPSDAAPDNLACVIYTSGSTGRPKGVLLPHRGLCDRVLWGLAASGLTAADRCLQITSPGFDVAIAELFEPLACGGQVIMARPGGQRDSAYLARLIGDQRVAVCNVVPAMLRLLLEEPGLARCRDLRHVFCGAEELPAELARRFFARSRATLHNIYGPTETSIDALCWECTPAAETIVPIGRAIAGASAYVLDVHMRPAPIGIAGELHIAGAGLARGYVGRSDLTAARFIPNPFAEVSGIGYRVLGVEPSDTRYLTPDTRLYKTGDLARYRPDGLIEFVGRVDQQVKIRGFRIEPGEIEAALALHPSVRACAVTAREDMSPASGYPERRLVAYIVPAEGTGDRGQRTEISSGPTKDEGRRPKDERPIIEDRRLKIEDSDVALSAPLSSILYPLSSELRLFLATRLPDYMIPAAFVLLDALPLTPNGKLDRKALPAPTPAPRAAQAAPRSEIEWALAGIWQELLGVEQVGVEENFFELGGHSLLLVQLQGRLRELLGREVAIVELFQHPTIARLAAHLSPAASEQPPPARAAPPAPHAPRIADIAIVGMAGRFPGARDVEQFWANLRDGVESISFFSEEELAAAGVDPALPRQPNYVAAKGLIDDVELFDAAFFGYTPREAELIDPQQRLFLECAWEALERAGHDPERYAGRIGVFAGSSLNTYWFNLYTNADLVESAGGFQTVLGVDPDYLATRASYKLNLRGPSLAVQSACSTSLVAAVLACRSLLDGDCDMALAGGVSVTVPLRKGYLYQEGGIYSPDGHCRAFDAEARGTVGGDGVGVVALKRLDDALADGDTIYALIKGAAINNDGADKVGYTAPSVAGQAAVIAAAQAQAGVDPSTIGYVEAHGTATPLGDPIELAALTQVFRAATGATGVCALGSVKSNIGHLDAAAGVAGLIKAALALRHKQIPPSLHYSAPNPNIDFAASPFYVNARLADWPSNGYPRRAGVSSFGIGGTNAHVVLEEAPALAPSDPARPWQLLPLSARTPVALEAATANLAEYLRREPSVELADVAYTLQTGRRMFAQRRVLVCHDREDAAGALEVLAPERVLTAAHEPRERPVAFLFPGQGAQYAGMARDLYEGEPVFRAVVDECAELLRPHLALDIREAIFDERRRTKDEASDKVTRWQGDKASSDHLVTLLPGHFVSEDMLDQIWLALPALFVIDYALARLWISWGITPQALIGYSLGEYVAACLAGVFSLEDALALVAARARLMHGTPAGAMLIVPLAEDELRPLLGPALALALINGPALCVVAGPVAAVEDLQARLAARGLECRRLPVEHAYHSALMEPIADAFVAEVRKVRLSPPCIPYISNVTGDWIADEQATDPRYWGRHLCETVRFADGLRALCRTPGRMLLEVGPGRSLSALARLLDDQPEPPLVLASMRHPRVEQHDRAALLAAAGQLWLAGAPLNWAALHDGEHRLRVLLPTYPFERRRYWIEPAGRSAPARIAMGKRPDLADWFYLPAWRQSLPPRPFQPGDLAGQRIRWLILADERGLAERIIRRLEQEGQELITMRAGAAFGHDGARGYTIDPRRAEDYAALLADLRARGAAPEAILHLWSISPDPALDRGYYSLLFLAQALDHAGMDAPLRLEVVTSELHGLVPAERTRPEQATLLGPCRVIPQEYPHISCRCIDIIMPRGARRLAALADQLIAEFRAASPDATIAYRGPQRWVESFEPVRLGDGTERRRALRPGGVYLITGGLGAVGLLLAEHLARVAQARLVLLGRTALPPRERWDDWLAAHPDDPASRTIRRLQAILAHGAELLILSADVADEAQMRDAIARTYAQFGALHGVLHAAGVTHGPSILRPLHEIGRAESRDQLRPKLDGTRVLERVLRGRAFDFCLLFSSNAAVLGGLGFVGYAAANLFLDAFATQRDQAGDPRWISASWDGWLPDEAQIAPSAFHTSMDQYAMTRAEAVAAFERVAAFGAGRIVVSTGDLPARLAQWVARPAANRDDAPLARHPRPSVQTAYAGPRTPVEERLIAIWQEQLGIDHVGIHDNFFELGGHSLLAMRLMAQVQQQLGRAPVPGAPAVDLPLRALFDAPTVAGLAEHVERAYQRAQEPQALAILPVPRSRGHGADEAPLSFAQQRLWFLDRLQPNSSSYVIPAALRLRGRLDISALRRSLGGIVARHEALRTTFVEIDGRPVQVIAPAHPLPRRSRIREGTPSNPNDASLFAPLRVPPRIGTTNDEQRANSLPLLDLTGLPAMAREAVAIGLVAAEARRPFDLARGPLLRAGLLRLGPREHIALLAMHHIISDGWSIDLFTRELTALYASFGDRADGHAEPPLPALPIQYADYAIWQRAWLQGERLQTQLDYWRSQLADLPPLGMPADHPRSPVAPAHGRYQTLTLPPALGERLAALGRQEEATLFMALLAGFMALLARYSGQNDIAVGTPIAGRTRAETAHLIGFFVNTLVLRADLSGAPGFLKLLRRVRAVCLDAYAHQDLPFEQIVEALAPVRDLTRHPLFQVMFSLQDAAAGARELPGLRVEPLSVDSVAVKFDLELGVVETPGGLAGNLIYNPNLFDAPTIARLVRDYRILLEGIAAAPQRPIAELPLLDAAGRQQVLLEWNVTARPFPEECLHQRFAAQVVDTPDAVALIFDPKNDSGTKDEGLRTKDQSSDSSSIVHRPSSMMHLTYAELNARSNQLAHHLRALGVGPEVRVGVCVERSPAMIVGILGILKAGGAYVPIDPVYPPDRIQFMLEDSGVPVLIVATQDAFDNVTWRQGDKETNAASDVALSPSHLVTGSGRTVVDLSADWDAIARQPTSDPPTRVRPDHLAYVIYTSGSTGRPKGTMITQRSARSFIASTTALFAVTPADHVLQFASFCFDVSVFEIFTALLNGALLCLTDRDTLLSPLALTALLRAYRITIIDMAPAVMALLPGDAFPDLRIAFVGGEAFSGELVNRWTWPGRRFFNGYGPTESTVTMTALECAGHYERTPPIGRPLPNHQVYVLDRGWRPVPIGVAGEMYIGGVGLARGYLCRPELTAEKFVPNPFVKVSGVGYQVLGAEPSDTRYPIPATRLYRTGDLVRYLPDGNIEFLGRADHQIKIRGFRVELGEIEALLAQHEAVREAAVLDREDRAGERRLVAYVVFVQGTGNRGQGTGVPHLSRGDERALTNDVRCPEGTKTNDERSEDKETRRQGDRKTSNLLVSLSPGLDAQAPSLVTSLRAYLRQTLPDYMIPAAFVMLDALPLNSSGKLDRRMLPPPDWSEQALGASYVAPRTPIEELVASVTAQVLGVERVGIDDNFFALGGHSLLATRVVSRLRAVLGVELPLRALFEAPTLAELAASVEAARRGTQLPPVPPIRRSAHADALPLSFAQQRLWFLAQLHPGSPTYNMPIALRLEGALGIGALRRSLNAIIARHASLRTTFVLIDERPAQVIGRPAPMRLPLIDLTALPTSERPSAARRLAAADALRSFDLAARPPVSAALLRLAAREHVALLNMHHVVSDGWSTGVLVREIAALYDAFAAGTRPALPDLPIQYADYAVWQRAWLKGAALEAQLTYWRAQLADLPGLALATDRPRPPALGPRGAWHDFALSPELSAALIALGRQEVATLFMTLLAAWQALLGRLGGQDDLAVGAPIAGRTRAEVEGLIGCFVNTLVLRADLRGNPTFRALLARVREVALGAYAHQDLPFEELVETLQPERDLGRHPLFQVMFTLQNAPVGALELAGLTIRTLEPGVALAKFDLELTMVEHPAGLAGTLVYRPDLFDAMTIARMAGQFQALLAAVAAEPDRRLFDLPLLSKAACQQVLVEWNDTTTGDREQGTGDRTIHALFEAQAARTPDAVTLVFETKDERRTTNDDSTNDERRMTNDPRLLTADCRPHITYAELNRRANRLAHHLRGLGVGPEVRVGVCLDRSPDLVVALLGVLKAGGAYVPLDPAYPAERLNFMLEDARAQVLITTNDEPPTTNDEPPTTNDQRPTTNDQRPMTENWRLATGDCGDLVTLSPCHLVNLVADWPIIAREPAEEPPNQTNAQNLAYVIYTSGSTGRPKGVMVAHAGLPNLAAAQIRAFEIDPRSRVLQFASPSFDAAVSEMFTALLAGAALVLAPRAALLPGPELLRLLDEQAITCVTLPPAALIALPDPPRPDRPTIVAAGAACPCVVVERWVPGRRFLNAYGPTEASVCATIATCAPAPGDPPIGRPLQNAQVYILDRRMRPAPIGVAGELYIGGVGLARGYLARPDLTAACFIPNPFAEVSGIGYRVLGAESSDTRYPIPDTRLYKTGDLARYRPDGLIEFIGRIDQQLKLRGYRIEPGEVEAALLAHPVVYACVVIARAEPAGEPRLVAYIVQGSGVRSQGSEDRASETLIPDPRSLIPELRAFLAARLPDYMIPAAFVVLDALPLTPSGKLDRRALPAPATVRERPAGEAVPRDALERQLIEIWEELLGVRPIGVTERFFDLGGSSLLAVRLLERIQARIGQRLPVTALFEAPTVAQLADLLRERGWPGALRLADRLPEVRDPIVAIKPGGAKPPFFFVAPLGGVLPSNMLAGFLDLAPHFDRQQPYYGVQLPGMARRLLRGLDLTRAPAPERLAELIGQSRPDRRGVEEEAAECVRALRQMQPDGPYMLGGFSTGGVVAFEIAQQLRAQGQPVGLLALVDTTIGGLGALAADTSSARAVMEPDGLTGALAALAEPDLAELAWFIGRDLGAGRLSRDLPDLHADLQRLDADQRWRYAAELLRAAGAAPDAQPDELRKLFAIYQLNKLSLSYILAGYAPRVYPGRITYFKASRVFGSDAGAETGWERFSAQPLELHFCPGDHGTLFQEPHVQVLARLIQSCLDAALAAPARSL